MNKPFVMILVVGLINASAAFAGISVTTQSRSVTIIGQVPGTGPQSSFDQSTTAVTDAPFNLSLQNTVGTGDVTASASASQISTLDLIDGGIALSARGSVNGASSDVNSSFTSSSEFSLTFVVDTATPYLFSEQVSSGEESDLGLLGADLTRDGQSLFGIAIPGLPRLQAVDVPSFQTTGILSPGTYTLDGGAAGNGNLTAVDATYAINFSVSSIVPASQLISLPTGWWSGAFGLALSALAARRAR
jgi:hypothetical protein